MAQQPMRGRAEGRWILRRAVTFSGLAVLAVLVVSVIELGVVLTHKEQGFVFTPRQAALWAALLLMLAALLLNGLVAAAQRAAAGPPAGGQPEAVGTPPPTAPGPVAARRTGLKALVIGTDGRASTSKLQAVLWTGAVLYALTMLLLLGKTVYAPTCAPTVTDCPDVSTYEDVFDDVVNQPLQPELLRAPRAAPGGGRGRQGAHHGQDREWRIGEAPGYLERRCGGGG